MQKDVQLWLPAKALQEVKPLKVRTWMVEGLTRPHPLAEKILGTDGLL